MMGFVPLLWVSGFVVYSLHDGRWGRLPWQPAGEWIDLHGSLGVLLWPIALLFGLYAITLGRFRLRRPANTAALIALALAVITGKLMSEDWLRTGQLHHLAYSLHLLAWLLIALSLCWHVCANLARGGMPLICSIASVRMRANDRPTSWVSQISAYLGKRD
jgi:hypothetical protein